MSIPLDHFPSVPVTTLTFSHERGSSQSVAVQFTHSPAFFSYLGFLSRAFTIYRSAGEGGSCVFSSASTRFTDIQRLARRLLQKVHLYSSHPPAAGLQSGILGFRRISLISTVRGNRRNLLHGFTVKCDHPFTPGIHKEIFVAFLNMHEKTIEICS